MKISIVLRAADAAQAAAMAHAIGLPLDEPERANPDSWHRRTAVDVLIQSVAAGERPGVTFGAAHHDRAVRALRDLLGDDAVAEDGRGDAVATGAGGLELRLERDAPRVRVRDLFDLGAKHALDIPIRRARADIDAAMVAAGASNARLVTNAMGGFEGHRRWLLVVDAPGDGDLSALARAFDFGGRYAPVEVVRSTDVDPDALARYDGLAFDL